MSFAKVFSAQTTYLKAHIVDIEVDLSNGMHSFAIVGLGDKAVDESKDRIAAAIKNSGFKSPKVKNQKVVISLAPAHVKKEGPLFDVGMALGYLLAAEEIDFNHEKKLFLGELSLDGQLRKITGILPLVKYAKEQGFEDVFLPRENAREAALITGINIYGASDLREIINHLSITKNAEKTNEQTVVQKISLQPPTKVTHKNLTHSIDFKDIKGQENAKRGLEIAASGGHNIALYGPPGTGKTMLAKAFGGILPALSFDEIIETTSIHSVAGILTSDLLTHPPFRSPHHTSSYISLIGGGAHPKPGEITLAHRGVLFLDEFTEFDRKVIDALRQPLEERCIHITRANGRATFPAHFILIAALNPCPCGNFGSESETCTCSPLTIQRYRQKISGPIVDRIDIWIEVGKISPQELAHSSENKDDTVSIRKRVEEARRIQHARFTKSFIKTNSDVRTKDINRTMPLNADVQKILDEATSRLKLSIRSYYRVIKLARTIADIDRKAEIEMEHMLEALQYRPKHLNND